jgi:hypothetical protein
MKEVKKEYKTSSLLDKLNMPFDKKIKPVLYFLLIFIIIK